jgi:hypothetical protein
VHKAEEQETETRHSPNEEEYSNFNAPNNIGIVFTQQPDYFVHRSLLFSSLSHFAHYPRWTTGNGLFTQQPGIIVHRLLLFSFFSN